MNFVHSVKSPFTFEGGLQNLLCYRIEFNQVNLKENDDKMDIDYENQPQVLQQDDRDIPKDYTSAFLIQKQEFKLCFYENILINYLSKHGMFCLFDVGCAGD